jgi:hypothetical protein
MFDTLLSMGGLSLLYASSNSWSTSFNLLFFYFTWTTLLLSHPPIKIELIGTIFVRVLFFWVPTLLFLLFDLSIPSLSRNLKLQGKRGVGQPALLRIKVLGWALVNMALGIAVQGAVEYLWVYVLGWKTALRIARTLPLPGELIWGVFRGIVVREVCFSDGKRSGSVFFLSFMLIQPFISRSCNITSIASFFMTPSHLFTRAGNTRYLHLGR